MALIPILFPLVRLFDPFLQKRILHTIFKQRPQNEEGSISLIKGNTTFMQSNEILNQDLDVTPDALDEVRAKSKTQPFHSNKKQSLVGRAVSQEDRLQRPFIHQISSQLRSSIIRRVLAFILLQEIPNQCKKIVKEGKLENFDQRDEYIASD